MPDARVAIEPSMAHKFQLEMWDALDDRGRRALGEYLSERLQANGWSIREPMALRPCGPRTELRSVLQWREPSSGMTFALIPRGKFRPGFDKAQMDRVAELISLDAGNKSGVAASLLAKVEPVLRLKPTVEISPFFLAAELVRPSLPGLRTVVQLKDDVIEGRNVGNFDFMGDGVEFRGGQVEPVLSHFGWSLATSVEFEWALRGGVSSLFYWGDEFPEFMQEVDVGWRKPIRPGHVKAKASFDAIMSAAFNPDRRRDWPWCNRFGLAAMLPRKTWCAASSEPGDSVPVIVRGGAAELYPWQGGCFEWLNLLNAFESRFPVPVGRKSLVWAMMRAAIRPMIRLV